MTGFKLLKPPATDEVEISLFGPGYGECVVCHLGDGAWMIVDSCLDPDTRKPVALSYLDGIGVPCTSVARIVATHWHDDHILGLSDLIYAMQAAKLVVTSAFANKEFKSLIQKWAKGTTIFDGNGLGELKKVMTLTSNPILASEDKIIYERQGQIPCRVIALSPSDASVLACIARLNQIAPSLYLTRAPSIRGNDASVVLSIEVGDRRILLGGDLQIRNHRNHGWLAIVDNHKGYDRPKHHVFKIPHHGSKNGDHAEIWEHLLVPDPYAILAPFVGGKTKLPTDADLLRIKTSTTKASLTAQPTIGKFRLANGTVAKTMKGAARSIEVIPHQFGHVRLRGKIGDSPEEWTVEYFGDAQSL